MHNDVDEGRKDERKKTAPPPLNLQQNNKCLLILVSALGGASRPQGRAGAATTLLKFNISGFRSKSIEPRDLLLDSFSATRPFDRWRQRATACKGMEANGFRVEGL